MLRHIVGILINDVFICIFIYLISFSVQIVVSNAMMIRTVKGEGFGRRRS